MALAISSCPKVTGENSGQCQTTSVLCRSAQVKSVSVWLSVEGMRCTPRLKRRAMSRRWNKSPISTTSTCDVLAAVAVCAACHCLSANRLMSGPIPAGSPVVMAMGGGGNSVMGAILTLRCAVDRRYLRYNEMKKPHIAVRSERFLSVDAKHPSTGDLVFDFDQ